MCPPAGEGSLTRADEAGAAARGRPACGGEYCSQSPYIQCTCACQKLPQGGLCAGVSAASRLLYMRGPSAVARLLYIVLPSACFAFFLIDTDSGLFLLPAGPVREVRHLRSNCASARRPQTRLFHCPANGRPLYVVRTAHTKCLGEHLGAGSRPCAALGQVCWPGRAEEVRCQEQAYKRLAARFPRANPACY